MRSGYLLCLAALAGLSAPVLGQSGELSGDAMQQAIDAARAGSDSRGLRPRSDDRTLKYNDHATGEGGRPVYDQPSGPPPTVQVPKEDAPRNLFELPILFATNSTELDYRSFGQLRTLAEVMNRPQNRTLRFKIIGHTDSVGAADANLILSIRRAAAVRSFLQQRGVQGERMEADGRGEFEPVDPVEGPNPRNRRVQFTLLG